MQEHLYCYVNSPYTIFVTNTHTHTHTHTHKHTCAHTYTHTCTHMHAHTHTCTHTHTLTHTYTHTLTHTYTHTHTHTDWACTTCRDFGFLFLTLFSQIVHVHECTHLCAHYVNSLYTILTHTHTTHTHTHTYTYTQTQLYTRQRITLCNMMCEGF